MGRDHRPAAESYRARREWRRPRAARFGRIGAGAGFIEKDEAAFRGDFQDIDDAHRDVRAEGAERLFETLFIADVREDLLENRHVAALACRNVHS